MPITKATHKNPLGLVVGQVVRIMATSHVGYFGTSMKKTVRRDKISIFQTVVVVGVKRRSTGTYLSGHPTHEMDSYEQSMLTEQKHHWFYEVKSSLGSNTRLVHKDDIIIGSN